MKQVLLTSAAVVVLAGSAQAQLFGGGECTGCLLNVQQLNPGDDYEVIRPGPRGEEGEPIELAPPPGPGWGDDEVIEPLPPGPPSDDDEDE